jgi:hypothetical protein
LAPGIESREDSDMATRSKRPTKAEIQAHYADDIKTATTRQLASILTGIGTTMPKYIANALEPLAREEMLARGIDYPDVSARFILAFS